MSLSDKFEELMSHLNAEDNESAIEFLKELKYLEYSAADDALWRSSLENSGVDNWEFGEDNFLQRRKRY